MKLVLNNITYHNCPVQLREQVSFDPQQQHLMLRKMHTEPNINEAVILDTCNRLEFYLYAKKNFDVRDFLTELVRQVRPDSVDVWSRHSRQAAGVEVARHLFEVAAGLDSQMLGENQVLSQVKAAYTLSLDCRMSKFMFHRLFHKAFRAGKAVRTQTDINCGAVSLSLAAVELAKRKLVLPNTAAMIIGAGKNAELAAKYLLKAGLTRLIIANRSAQKAKQITTRLKKGRVIRLDNIAANLSEVDLMISSTAAVEPIVTYESVKDSLAQRNRELLIIDIAVPRDIDPDVSRFESVLLYNIDDLDQQITQNIQKRSREIPKARKIIDKHCNEFAKWYESLNLLPVIARLNQQGLILAHSEAKRYAKDFGDNNDKLQLFAESLAKKLLHGPISFLKGSGDEEPSAEQLQAAEIINKMFLSREKET